ncbi:MAG: tripartite tricarboxylate transporter permease [Nanoarchaeota archaeon]
MIIEIILALLAGILVGTFTGLTPGIHINLVAALLLSLTAAPFVSGISPLALAIGVTSLAITHTIIDFIPSIYLGAPNEETVLSVLPGHALLKEGNGHEALLISVYGALFATIIAVLLAAPLIFLVPKIYLSLAKITPFLLIALIMYMALREKKSVSAVLVLLAAGFLGYAALNISVREPLLPLLTGLFGTSTLIAAIREKTILPPQKKCRWKEALPPIKDLKKTALSAVCIAPPCSFLPAIGSGYASLIAAEVSDYSQRGFLFLNGTMTMITMIWSFVIVYAIQKARTGAAAAILELLQQIQVWQIVLILSASIFASLIAAALAIALSRRCANLIGKINYQLLSYVIIALVVIVVISITRASGLVILITSTALGLYALQTGVKRTHLMACLIIPSILYYLG